MKTIMRQTLFFQWFRRVALGMMIVALALILLSTLPLQSAHAASLGQIDPGTHQCAINAPCIEGLWQEGTTIHFTWSGNYDGYNVHWSRPGKEGEYHVDGTSTTFTNAHPHTTYTFSVEGCTTHFLRSSTCTSWVSQRITTR